MLYLAVRRWFSAGAALIAGAVFAFTPVAVLMFRYNNPDALLVLLLVGAAYATTRAIEAGRTRWLVLAATLVGTGFITKMLQAFSWSPHRPVYLLAGPPRSGAGSANCGRRGGAGGVQRVVGGGGRSHPAADRPYIGGSQNNSLLNLIFGYNGFGRLSGNESGSVGGRGRGAGRWGPPDGRACSTPTSGADLVAAAGRAHPAGTRLAKIDGGGLADVSCEPFS